ncbi:MAG TPA: hypothetical protein VGS60_06720 [Actinomycetes bacterium]|jgi:hypothetical protein|nr:hypothetical protein [Actinomycetes bacterium]
MTCGRGNREKPADESWLAAGRRGRHRDALLVFDDLAGSSLGDDYPELAVCEVCGRAVEWPNGRPELVHREQE